MTTRLLVGVAEASELNEPRRYLLDLLETLEGLGVVVQVAMLEDGPLRRHLEQMAEVRVVDLPRHRSPAGLLQSVARRISPGLAERVHDLRVADVRRWIGEPDAIHLHGPKAAPLLRYARDPSIPVTVYSHHVDFSVAGTSAFDRQMLASRVGRYLVDRDSVESDLVAAGMDRARIERAPVLEGVELRSRADRSALRSQLQVPDGAMVVAVPPVPDWVDAPDLTLGVVWELERIAGDRAPIVVWPGMPESGDRRWPIDYDVARMGLHSLQVSADPLGWPEIVELADVVTLPIRTALDLPEGFARHAALRTTPIHCWEGHDHAEEVARFSGTVVDRGDVDAMARSLWGAVSDPVALRRARQAGWSHVASDLEQILMIEVPLP